jgi:hypothetical protein
LAVLTVLTIVILFLVSVIVVVLNRGVADRLLPGTRLDRGNAAGN